MSMLYWIAEYGKVMFGYLFLMFLWPSVVFYGHLKKKTMEYRFSFCVTVQIIIVNTVVLMLGLLHILTRWMLGMVFGGVFIIALLKYVNENHRKKIEKSLAEVNQGNKSRILKALKKYGLLVIVVGYGMLYFSYGAFQTYSYGQLELYTHHEWINGLMEGNIFSAGVYPEAMHCFIYCMNALFGIRIYNILLFLQGIHVAVFLISAYLLFRQVFHWQYTPIFVLVLFLVLDLKNADSIYNMSLLQMTVPMEFGLHTIFLCALHLMKYLNGECIVKKKLINCFWNENIFLFMAALAAAFTIHFYVLIVAAIVCAAFAVFSLKKLVNIKYFAPLTVAVLCACIIAAAPMAVALVQGIPVNDSIYREISAIDGHGSRNLREIVESGKSMRTFLRKIYKEGYAALYGTGRAEWLLFLTMMISGLCMFVGKEANFKNIRQICAGYPPVILTSVLYIFVYAAPRVGFSNIIPEKYFFAVGHMMALAVAAMAADVLFSGLAFYFNITILSVLSLASVAGIYGGLAVGGSFHGYLFYELTRYSVASAVTNSIIDAYPQHSYTIVSPTEELYQILSYGWHEELLSFVEKSSAGEYTIPSEYVFIYVEKKPILYGQLHAFSGPAWLGEEKYLEPYWNAYSGKYPEGGMSQSPEINASQISEEEADQGIPEYNNPWTMYSQLENRTVLESKAYDWCERFAERYPDTLKTYYEDEEFVCIYFQQDLSGTLYDLGIE